MDESVKIALEARRQNNKALNYSVETALKRRKEIWLDSEVVGRINTGIQNWSNSLKNVDTYSKANNAYSQGKRYLEYFEKSGNSEAVSAMKTQLAVIEDYKKQIKQQEKEVDKGIEEYNAYLNESPYVVSEDARMDYKITAATTYGADSPAAIAGQAIGDLIVGAIRGQPTPKATDGINTTSFQVTEKWPLEAKIALAEQFKTDKEAAVKYAEQVNRAIDLGEWEDFAKQNAFTASAAALLQVPFTLAGGLEYLENGIEYGVNKLAGKDAELRRSYGADISNSLIKGGKDAVDWNIAGWDAWDCLYGIGVSALNTAVAGSLMGSLGGVSLGLSAASSMTNDLLDRGASDGMALLGGGVAGVFEGLFESFSIGKLESFKTSNVVKFSDLFTEQGKKNLKDYFKILAKDVAKSTAVNASEEALTETANILYDTFVNSDISNYANLIKQYEEAGYSPEEAKKKAQSDLIWQIVESAASGAVMGAIFGSAETTSAYKNAGKIFAAEGKKYDGLDSGSVSALISEGLESPVGSKTRTLAERLQNKLKNGGKITGQELAAMVSMNERQFRADDTAKINTAVKNRLTELGETANIDTVSSAITKTVSGEKLTKDEQSAIANSRYGQRVLNEATTDNINSGEYSSAWAEGIGTDRINSEAYNLGVQDIDSVDNNGYNNVENANAGGGENAVHQQRGMEEGAGKGINSNSGGEGSVQRSFQESSENFSARSSREEKNIGQRRRVLLKHGKAQMAYTPAEANNDTNGGRAVQILRNIGINAELAEGAIETNENGVTTIHMLAFTTPDGNVYVSSDATSTDIEITAHEAVHVNDILGTEAFLDYEAVLCEQIDYNSNKYIEIAEIINNGHYNAKYDINSIDFYVKFRRELAAYVNQFVVTDFDFATQQFAELFYDWNAVVEASRQFNKDIGADFTESANFMPENSDLQSTAERTLGFEEEDTGAPNDKSYEQRVIEESQGIDSSLNAAQRRINKIAEKLGVKLMWDIDGDPAEVGNGYYENGVIHMNKRAKAKATVFAHEYVHYIEQSKLWPAFKKFIESTKAYENWITVQGEHSDVKQAEKNYKSKLETAYNKAGKKIADTDIIANFIAEGLFGGNYDGSAETNAETLLQDFAKNDKWYHNLARFFKGVISRLKGDKVQAELLKMERILQRARKDAQKNPTTDTGGRKYSLNTEFTKADFDTNYKKIISMEAVADLDGDEFAKGPVDLVTQVEEFFNSIGNVTESKYGTVELNRTGIKSSIGHGIGRNKAVAFKAVPSVLQKGEVIDYQENWKNRGYDTAVFAAPIKISNQDYFMAAVVNVEKNKNSYYLHEIALQKKENDASFKTGTAKNGTPSEASFSIYSLLQKLQNVNENSSKPYSVSPASEAETIARLAAEGRADEYKTEKTTSKLDARKTAERLLKEYKSISETDSLTNSLEKMKKSADNSAWDAVLKEAENAAGIILDGSEIKANKKDIAMGIFNELVESRENIRREQLADVQSKNEQYRRQLKDAQKDSARKSEQLKQSREEIRNEVLKERSDYSNRVKNRERIRKAVNSLDSKLRANSNVKHVPEGMQNAIRDFCRLFFENDMATFSGKDFAALYLAYSRNMGGDDSLDLIGGYTEDVLEMIGTAAEILEGKSLPKLKDSELVLLRDIAENLVHIVNNENELFINGKKKNLEEIGNKALEELQDKDSKKSLRVPGGDKVNEAKAEAERFFGTGNLKPIYFFETLGDTFKNLFSDMLEGQYECVRRLETAQTYVQGILTDFNYWQWINSEPIVIRLEKGGSIKLTKGQAMSLYATWRRESTNELQGAQHLTVGGVVLNDKQVSKKLNKKGKEGLLNYEEWVTKAHKLTENDIKAVMESLTSQQIEFVDEMISYLSNDMAVIGNEVTMNLYGIKRFKEDYYFPYKTAENFRPNEANGKKREKKIKNSSFTKQTVEKAKTPVVIEDFLEVWAKHVAEMCQYSTMTLPIENMQRVLGFRMSPDDNLNAQAVRAEVQRVAGKEGVQYVQQLLDDLNGGLVSLPGDSWYHLAVSRFKKNAVFASASVVVQQPSAVCRAFAVINPKYFVKTTLKFAERDYAELKKYCPVAVLKEAGRFDVGTGSQFADWLIKRSYKGAKEKGKALIFDSEYRDDKISAAAAKADEITWAHIWAAAKAQIKATTDLKVGSEEYFQAAAKLFNEAIEKTQVYDSVLTKSENMRSKSTFTQMTTAFMAEPTTSLNMLWQAVNDVKGKNYKSAGKLVGSVLSSIIFNAILKSIVTAARDEDEDESYAEKYLQEVIANFTGDVGIWNMIPVVKDVASIFEGYTVDRTDVSLIEDLYRGFQAFNSDKKSDWEKTKALIGPLAAFFGLPVKNVIRDGEAAWNVITMFIEGRVLGSGTAVKYAMLNGLTGNDSGNGQYYEMLYDAQREDDEEKYQEVYDLLVSKGVDEKDIKAGIRKYYRESEEIKQQLESYEEKIIRSTYYKKLEDEDKDKVVSKIKTFLVEKAMSEDTGDELSSSSKKAIRAQEKGVDIATYFLASGGFEDTDKSGGISNKEKIAAISKMDISEAEKHVLISLYTSREKIK